MEFQIGAWARNNIAVAILTTVYHGEKMKSGIMAMGRTLARTTQTLAGIALTKGLQRATDDLLAKDGECRNPCAKLIINSSCTLIYTKRQVCRRMIYGAPYDPLQDKRNWIPFRPDGRIYQKSEKWGSIKIANSGRQEE